MMPYLPPGGRVSRLVSFAIFISIAIGITAAIHYYLWVRLVRDIGLIGQASLIATVALVALSLSLPLVVVVGRLVQHPAIKPFIWTAYVWMGLMFLLFTCLVGADMVRVVLFVGRKVFAAPGGL